MGNKDESFRVRCTPELKQALLASAAKHRRTEMDEARALLEYALGLVSRDDLSFPPLPGTTPNESPPHEGLGATGTNRD